MVSAEHLRYKTKYTFLYCCTYFYLVLPARKNLLFEKRYSCLAYQIARRRQLFSKWQPTDFLRAKAVLRPETHFLNKMILIVSWQNFPSEIRTYIESGISEVFFKNSLFTKRSIAQNFLNASGFCFRRLEYYYAHEQKMRLNLIAAGEKSQEMPKPQKY